MTEKEIKIKLLKAQLKAQHLLVRVATGLLHLEHGNLQAAADSIPPDDDPPSPPGGDDDHDH